MIWNSIALVLGGIGTTINNTLIFFDINSQKSQIIERDEMARVNYVSVLVDQFVILHGGEYRDKFGKIRISDSLFLFNIQKQQLIQLNCKDPVLKRKNHVGFYWNNKYFFEGGFD